MEKNLPTRRDLLLKSGAGLIALAGVSNSDWMAALADTVTVAATPSQTEGPYFVEEKLNRSDIRVDPATSLVSAGFPLVLGITASRISNGTITPLSGAYIDVWHCDATGIYSDEQANGSSGKKFLRGYQVSDGHGNVRFTTVYPGWYQGRTVHIHFKVRMYSGSSKTYEFNSQLYFDEATTTAIYSRPPYNQRPNRDTFNATDGIYRGGGSQLMLRMAQDGTHALSSFHVMLNA
jgi:protocatechuate 3,4-dioxygenase beta subunit